jgi:hypothetical protein
MNELNNVFTDLDSHQIMKVQHSDEYAAQRVVIVGMDGKDLNLNVDKLDIKMPEMKEQQVIVKELEIKEIEKQVIVPYETIKIVEVPVIVKEIQVVEVEKVIEKCIYKEISVPVMTSKIEIVRVPEYLERVVMKEVITLPLYYKIAMGVMIALTLGSILIHIR